MSARRQSPQRLIQAILASFALVCVLVLGFGTSAPRTQHLSSSVPTVHGGGVRELAQGRPENDTASERSAGSVAKRPIAPQLNGVAPPGLLSIDGGSAGGAVERALAFAPATTTATPAASQDLLPEPRAPPPAARVQA